MKKISDRVKRIGLSPTLELNRKSKDLKIEKGIDIINLSVGETDFNTPQNVKDAAKEAIDNNENQYSPVSGRDALRDAIVNKFWRENALQYERKNILVSTGAKQSLTNLILSLVNPNDEVLIPKPYWVSYPEMVRIAGGTPVFIDSSIETHFKITPKQLEEVINKNTKVFIFSSPANPSGAVYTKKELKELAKVFAKYPDIIVISDEIYEHLIYEGEHESIAQFHEIKEQTVVVNGVSKSFAMTGWRIGYIAAPEYITRACEKLQSHYTSGACTISQWAVVEALSNTDYAIMSSMKEVLKQQRNKIVELINETEGMCCEVPEGTFYAFPNVKELLNKRNGDFAINTVEKLAEYFLEEAHVACVPGSAFGNYNCLRMSFVVSENRLIEAFEKIRKAISKLK